MASTAPVYSGNLRLSHYRHIRWQMRMGCHARARSPQRDMCPGHSNLHLELPRRSPPRAAIATAFSNAVAGPTGEYPSSSRKSSNSMETIISSSTIRMRPVEPSLLPVTLKALPFSIFRLLTGSAPQEFLCWRRHPPAGTRYALDRRVRLRDCVQ